MKKIRLDILLYDDGANPAPCLENLAEDPAFFDISLYCVGDFPDAGIEEHCRGLAKRGRIKKYQVVKNSGGDFMREANCLFLTGGNGLLLLLSSRVIPAENLMAALAQRLLEDNSLAGINPVLLCGWNKNSAAFLGAACDFRRHLHYVYEGIPLNDPLAALRRKFQFAHPGCLMLRKSDFRAQNGFNTGLDYLAFYDFCLRLAAQGKSFSAEPGCHAILADRFDSWKFCGMWNSAVQTGRLRLADILSDYPLIAKKDNLDWRLDAWLNEYPEYALAEDYDALDRAWLAWRRRPDPPGLLEFLSLLVPEAQREAIELARLLPVSLPLTLKFYDVQAGIIRQRALEQRFYRISAQAEKWKRSRKDFSAHLLKPAINLLRKNGLYNCSINKSTAVFNAWVEIGEKRPSVEVKAPWPEMAVVMPVFNPDTDFLAQAMESVMAQSYPHWRLCVADDASTDPEVGRMLRAFMEREERIKVVFRGQNGHICRATNSALELVDAPYAGFLDNDDLLAPEALALVAECVHKNPALRFIFSDEDHVNAENERFSPIFKQDFNEIQFFPGHFSVFATDAIREAGGLRPGFEGSQDFDLTLRITEKLTSREIRHIPHILYHWRVHDKSTASSLGAKPYVLEATKSSMLSAAGRQHKKAEVVATGKNNFYNLAYSFAMPACSVIFLADMTHPLPNAALFRTMASALGENAEFLLQPVEEAQTFKMPAEVSGAEIKTLAACGHNLPGAINAATKSAGGEILLFLHCGLEPLPGCRPDQLVYHALQGGTAICGGMIWKNGFLVNGGWYPDVTGLPFILHHNLPKGRLKDVSWGQFLLTRPVLGVSWQCACLRKSFMEENGFLDESLGKWAFLDFCLRGFEKGKSIIVSPFGRWENGLEEKPDAPGEIFARYGEWAGTSGLRNANLRAAPDYGWTLIF